MNIRNGSKLALLFVLLFTSGMGYGVSREKIPPPIISQRVVQDPIMYPAAEIDLLTPPPMVPQVASAYLDDDELVQVLIYSNWPKYLYPQVRGIAYCEASVWVSPTEQRLDPGANTGDGGLALGLMSIRIDYHPDLVARYNLTNAVDNLNAGFDIYTESGNTFQVGWPRTSNMDCIGKAP